MNQGNFQEIVVIGCSNEISTDDALIFVYDLHTGSQIMKFKQNNSSFKGISLSEKYIFSNQKEKPIIHLYIWQKESIHQKIIIPEPLSAFTVSHNVYWAAGGTSQGRLYFWQISSGNLMFVHNAHYQKITAITFTMNDTFFLTGSEDGSLCLWRISDIVDLNAQKDAIHPVKTWNDHGVTITDIFCGFGTDNTARIFTSSLNNIVNVWDLGTLTLLTTFALPEPVTCLTVDPAERTFYVGTNQGNVYLVDLYGSSKEDFLESFYEAVGGSKKIVQGVKDESNMFKGHTDSVLSIALSFDASLLITGSKDKNLFVWDIATRQIIHTLKQNGSVTSICCKVIHRGFFQREVVLENIPAFKRIQSFKDMDNHCILKKLDVFNDSEDETAWYENDLMLMRNDLNEFMSIKSESLLQLQTKNLQDELQKLYKYYFDLRDIHQDLWTAYIKSQQIDHNQN